jgi:hypothetical protein
MSSKKTSKIVVKSEVTTTISKKRKRGKDSDGDGSDADDDDAHVRLACAVKKEKSEVTETLAKKRKRGNGDGDEDVKDAIRDHKNDASVRKKEKKNKRVKRHACTEPRCGNISICLQLWLSILEGIRVKNHLLVRSQAAVRRLRRKTL